MHSYTEPLPTSPLHLSETFSRYTHPALLLWPHWASCSSKNISRCLPSQDICTCCMCAQGSHPSDTCTTHSLTSPKFFLKCHLTGLCIDPSFNLKVPTSDSTISSFFISYFISLCSTHDHLRPCHFYLFILWVLN